MQGAAKYSLFVGRFQPLHLGHELVIREMIALGFTPVIGIGSAQEARTEKNPYSLVERAAMLDAVLPESAKMFFICDNESWDQWLKDLKTAVLDLTEGEIPIHFVQRKPVDLVKEEVIIDGRAWKNFHWFDAVGFPIHEQTYARRMPEIHATDVRRDIEGNRDILHPMVYRMLRSVEQGKNIC